jgi:glycosyltransferase involved in cell wall biosynthesis
VPLASPVDIDGVKVWYFPSKRLRRLYWSPEMGRALKDRAGDFDVVHLHSIFLWPTWAAARAARRSGVPYIVAPRGMLVKELVRRKSRWIKSAWINLIEKANLEHAAAIHVTSALEAEELCRFGFKLPKIVIVPNGVDTASDGDGKPSLSPDIMKIIRAPFLLFLGRINWKKGIDRLIPALSYVPEIPLVIAGNDEENYTPELQRLAKTHGVSDRIYFAGPVHGDDKIDLLNHASALVLPSYSENFGIVVLEAMAAGRPVVITPDVGLADTVRETGSGVVVKGDPDVLAGGIRNLLSNPGLMQQMGENGKRVVKEQFTWEAVAQKMEGVYADMLSQGHGKNASGTRHE